MTRLSFQSSIVLFTSLLLLAFFFSLWANHDDAYRSVTDRVADVLSSIPSTADRGGPPSSGGVAGGGGAPSPPARVIDSTEKAAIEAAGNATLGFHKILLLNLPGRYDRADAIAIQSYLSGVQVDIVPGVEYGTLEDRGLPPNSRPAEMPMPVKACWRGHANIWAEMLLKRLPPTLILEADASWDINVRSISSLLNKHFRELLRATNSQPYADPHGPPPAPGNGLTHVDPSDPWHGDHWDILSVGHCNDGADNRQYNVTYDDPSVPPGEREWFGERVGSSQRVVRRSGGITCTTGYAVTQRGAAKLLLRSGLDLNEPVDLLIRSMILDGSLRAYSMMPAMVSQWTYADDTGMQERMANSDIHVVPDPPEETEEEETAAVALPTTTAAAEKGKEAAPAKRKPKLTPEEKAKRKKAWEEVWKRKSVWLDKPADMWQNRNMAMKEAWGVLFSNNAIDARDGASQKPGAVADTTLTLGF